MCIRDREKGQVLEGTVKNITSYGVFMDLGGVDGLCLLYTSNHAIALRVIDVVSENYGTILKLCRLFKNWSEIVTVKYIVTQNQAYITFTYKLFTKNECCLLYTSFPLQPT